MNFRLSPDLMDSISARPSPARVIPRWFWGLPLFVSAALLLVCCLNSFQAASRPHGERKERSSGRNFAARTDVQRHPRISPAASGWDSERVWSEHDDWEPFVAADRSSSYVYQMTTRFNAQVSGIFIRRSVDGGRTWDPSQLIAPVEVWQADPQVEVADDGTVFVVWLDGPNWMSKLVKSYDHGATWTEPIVIAPALRWTDHPWLVVSPDGQDVYVGLNMDDSFIVTSHDGGQTFGTPIQDEHKTYARTLVGCERRCDRSRRERLFRCHQLFPQLSRPGRNQRCQVSMIVARVGRPLSLTLLRRRLAVTPPRVATMDFSLPRPDWRSTRVAKSCWFITRATLRRRPNRCGSPPPLTESIGRPAGKSLQPD